MLRGLTRIELRRGLSDLRGGKGGGGGQSGGDDGDGLHVWMVLFFYDVGCLCSKGVVILKGRAENLNIEGRSPHRCFGCFFVGRQLQRAARI